MEDFAARSTPTRPLGPGPSLHAQAVLRTRAEGETFRFSRFRFSFSTHTHDPARVRGPPDLFCQRRFSPPPSHVEGTWPSTASWERPAATLESGGGQHGIWPRIRALLHQPHLRRCQAARSTGHRHRPSAAPKCPRARTHAPHSPARGQRPEHADQKKELRTPVLRYRASIEALMHVRCAPRSGFACGHVLPTPMRADPKKLRPLA